MNTTNLPIRYDYYLQQSERWSEIFADVSIPKTATVLELCTGWSPKIGLALARYRFAGTFWITDQSSDALSECRRLLEPVHHEFVLKDWTGSVLSDALPEADVIVMNHALDDILLNAYLMSLPGVSKVSETEYSSIDQLRKTWMEGANWMEENSQDLAMHLAHQLHTAVTTSHGKVIISQYAGYQEKLHKLDSAISLTATFKLQLKQQLQKIGFSLSDYTSEVVVSTYIEK